MCLAIACNSELVGSEQVDNGQTNSVLFHLSVWLLITIPRTADSGQDDDGQTNSQLLDVIM
jgi:hypothetical protein